jgi:hypothetical protein
VRRTFLVLRRGVDCLDEPAGGGASGAARAQVMVTGGGSDTSTAEVLAIS